MSEAVPFKQERFTAFLAEMMKSSQFAKELVEHLEANFSGVQEATRRLIELSLFERAKDVYRSGDEADIKTLVVDYQKYVSTLAKDGDKNSKQAFTQAHLKELQDKLKLL